MTVSALLTELRTRDIHVWADGDRLQCNAPAAVLTPELRDQLQQRKHEILAFLRGPVELSFAQQRLWFLDRLEPGGAAYIISGALELRGALNAAALERGLNALVDRHESLRTVFVEAEGEPRQMVSEAGAWALAVTDLSREQDARERLKECLREEASRGFDLARGPLFRAKLYRLAPDTHVLLLAMHHIISDGWSMGVLIRELGELYRGFLQAAAASLPALRVQYRDFARWQRGWLKGEVLERELAHWRGRLKGAPQVLELPTDRVRPAVESHRGASYALTLPRELVERLRELSRREGATLFMTLLAGFALLLSRYSNQQDLLIGTPVANRNRAEIEGLIGFFVNTLVLRADTTGEPTVREFLARMREACLEAYAHQDLPFERLVEELHPVRDLSRNAVFQVMFALQNAPHGALELPGLTLKPVETGAGAAQFDLSLLAWETPQGLAARLSYATDLFDESTVARMGAHWRALLEAMVATPERRVAELPLLTEPERRQVLVEWNDTKAEYPAPRCVQEWVEEVARRQPQALAVQCGAVALSYGELEARAEALAARLRERGVGEGALVAVYVERSVEMVVALLAVWKAGAAYVPIDPQYPPERVRFMLQDAQAPVVVTQDSLAGALPATGAAIVSVDAQEAVRAPKRGRRAKRAPASPQALAYVIYTSGSTGQPKGVAITHASLCNLIGWHQRAYGLTPADRATQLAGPAFDASVWELWPYLTAGASVHLPDEATRLDPAALVRWLAEQAITVSFLPTPLAEAALREHWPKDTALRVLLTGGDRLSQRPAQALPFRLVNHYGPTENTVVSTCAEVEMASRGAPPIGRPLPNTRAYVVDARLQPVPVGVPGELLVGGVQLAKGYWNRPELTEEKFVPDPFQPGGRLYRTGDLVRYLADGNIEFLGRIDTQVKVRGFRIELGEIEAALSEHAGVRETVVLAREDTPGEKRLVAYVVGEASATELKEHLAGRLPSYMVPAAFVTLEALPLTPNGKVDRKALPAPERSGLEAAYIAPRTPTEEKLARIWAEVLKVERVGIHDNFFELGGHSLLAVTLIERMRRAGLNADVRALFTTSTLAELAQAVGGESGIVAVPPNRIPAQCEAITPEMLPLVSLTPEEIARVAAQVPGGASNIQDIYPLAPLQEGILFHHLMAREGDPYLLHTLTGFDSRARLDGYLKALQSVIDRHDILRTAVLSEGVAEPVQVVWRAARLKVEEVKLDPADGDVARQLHARFDPRRYRIKISEAPLLRVFIAEDKPNARWVMLRLFHHLAIDHTAAEVVQQEVRMHLLGEAEKLPAPLPFRNFVAQARLGVKREEHEAYFKKLLGEVEETTAPFGLTDVQGDGSGITEARRRVDPQLAKRLRERSRALGVSAAALCHLAYAQVLARTSGRDDVVFGTVLFGRMQGGEGAERVLGLFINTLPVRIRVGEAGVEEAVKSTHAQLAQLLRHEHASLALAQRCSAVAAPAPLFSALLNYRHSAVATHVSAETRRAGEGIKHLGSEERTTYPLVLMVDDLDEGGLGLTAQAQSPIDPERICGYMQRALEELVRSLEATPDAPARDIDVLPARERDQLLEGWHRALSYRKGACLHERFEAQVARAPGAVALVFEGERLTYGELNARANRLAHRLRELGVAADQLVGLRVERGLEMVVGLLAILKAGGAYLPLDPAYPKERIAFMLEDSAVGVVLTQKALARDLAGLAVSAVLLDEPLAGAATNPAPLAGADNLAYVIYTSGSTGKPKGAQITHYNVTRLMEATEAWYRFNADDVWTLFHSYAFDFSVWELWGALLYGGRVVIVPYWVSRAPEEFRELLIRERVTVLNQTPSAFRQLMQADLARSKAHYALRYVVFGGEALELQSLRPWFERYGDERPLLVNMYGITETTVHVTYRPIRLADLEAGRGSVIGEPIPDLRVYILDPRGEPAPIGVPGEMYVGGAGVARGYLNRAELTAQRFLPDPFEPGGRLYRTGDLARRLANGDIEYLGRIDSQVKIRGFRIELGEIESTLSQYPAIREAVVLAREDSPGDKRLVAYVVSSEPPADFTDALRAHLRAGLPEYMVPSAFVMLEALPLTENGKVDRKALPAPERSGLEAEYVAPRTPTEESLAQIWGEVLKVERVGANDNFFELGGHSLLAVTVIERMRRAGLNADARALFTTSTLAELAQAVGGESGEVEVPPNRIPAGCEAITPEMLPLVTLNAGEIARIAAQVPGGASNIQDIYPLAPLQEGILFHHLMARAGDPYLLYGLAAFDTRARLDGYLKALQSVIDRHDILRTAVLSEGLAEPVQVVWRKALLKVEEVSLDPAEGDVARQLHARYDPRRYRIKISEAPLLRLFIAEDRANSRWVLLQLFHHLAIDHTASELVQQEVRAHLVGQADKLAVPLPFRNFVAQARLGVKREEHEAYFKKLLGNVEEPTAPFGLVDVQGDGSGITEARQAVEPRLAKRLRERSRALGVSAASLCHLAYAQVLSRTSGRDDVVFGTVLFGRMQGGEGAERVLGLFINTLPVRIRVDAAGVEEAVKSTHAQLAQLLRHEHASLALAQRCSAVAAPAPLFSSLLNYRHGAVATHVSAETRRAGEGIRHLGGEERTNYPLVLAVDDLDEGLALTAQAQSPIDPERICGYMQRALEELIRSLETTPDAPVRALDVLPASERHRLLVEWNDTQVDYPAADALLHELFEAQAHRTPEATAVVFEEKILSYRELDARANQLAQHLRERGIRRGALVALCIERSLEMVVGMLGILKAGGAYVPVEPDLPVERMAYVLEDVQPPIVLTQQRLQSRLPKVRQTISLDADWPAIARQPAMPASREATASDIAYVIYTSGSTGRPKGVMVPHAAICNHMLWMQRVHRLDRADAILQKTPYGFDASVWEFFAPLLAGAKLVVARPGGHLDPAYLAQAIRAHGVSTLQLVPSQLRMLLAEPDFARCAPPLKHIYCGGEALTQDLCSSMRAKLPHVRLHNLYGPTEAAIDSTSWDCPLEGAPAVVPIGTPIDNVRTYVVGPQMQLAPIGVPGELLIGGAGLARGYLNLPELTAEKFVPDPFSSAPGTRVYRTGDLVRRRADGSIEFLGRIDHQVKVRGYRIEPGEIETALSQHPAVRQSVVLAREDAPGDQRLVAYVVAKGEAASTAELKEHLARQLPHYMVPAAFVALEQLPLTPNGKVDRKALPAPEGAAYASRGYEAPRTPTEEILAGVWAEVLKLERVGIHDNFFELGGHSLLAVTMVERMRQAGLNADVRALFATPTLAEFAAATEDVEIVL